MSLPGTRQLAAATLVQGCTKGKAAELADELTGASGVCSRCQAHCRKRRIRDSRADANKSESLTFCFDAISLNILAEPPT
jgi:hypothetical protein